MSRAVRTTVVVVTWRGRTLVGPCLDALAGQTRPHRVLVVDNASDDGTATVLAEHRTRPDVLRMERNRGYAGALASAQVSTPFTAWLNDDARPEPGWLAALEDALDRDAGVAAAGSVLHDDSGSVVSAGVSLSADGHGYDDPSGSHPFGFCGGAVLLRTAALADVGGVPGGYFCYYEDTDTSWRLRAAGHSIVVAPAARVHHLGGVSSGHGSPLFHRWNERNRLLTLLRCAPRAVAVREVARFAALTAALPLRRLPDRAPNHTVAVRSRVLLDLVARLPRALLDRRRIGRRSTVPRGAVWRSWAGRI